MRIVLVFVLALMGFGAFAQEGSQYIGTKEGAVRVRGTLYADSGFYLPKRPLRSARIYDTGAVYYQLSDSSAYVWTGSQWNKIGSETTSAGNLISKTLGVYSFPGTWSSDVTLDGAVSSNPTRSWIMSNLYQFKVTDGVMAIGLPGEASSSPYMGTKYSPNNDFDTAVSVRATGTKVSGGNVIINANTSVKVTGSPLSTSTDTTTYKPAALASDGTLKRMASWPAASGGGGSQTLANVLATGRTLTALDSINNGGYKFKFKGHLWSDSVLYSNYQVLGPTPTTVYTLHPLTGKNVIGKVLPTYGTYAYPESGFGNEGGGFPGAWMDGQQALRFGWDGAAGGVSLIQGFGSNRLSIQSVGAITSIAATNRFEFEGSTDANKFVTFTGYRSATANTWPILFASDPTTPNTSLGVLGREGELPFAIYNSSYRQKSAFNFRGYLAIGDTTNIIAGLTITTPMVTRGIPQIRLYDSTFNTNFWELTTTYAYTNTDINFGLNGSTMFGATANGAFFLGLHDPGFNRLSIKGYGNTSSTYSIYAKNSSNTFLFGVRDDGEIYIGSATDNGAFTLQNTGGLYQQGSVSLRGTNATTSPSYVVAKLSDSTLAEITLANLSTAMGTDTMYAKRGVTVSADSIVLDNTTETITSGSATTIANASHVVIVDPASVLASHTITLPAAPYDKQEVAIYFGGTVAGNATVVTTLTISANTGQALMQKAAPSTALGGDCFIYKYVSSNAKWYRKQ